MSKNYPVVYKVCLEIGYDRGWIFAHLPELAGCFSKERSREESLKKLPDAIRHYFSWIKSHGENCPDNEKIEIEISETFRCYNVKNYEVNAFFEADRPSLTKEEIETGILRMGWSRQDLLSITSQLPPEILDRKLDKNRRSIRETLEHVATAEWWYLTRINLSVPHHREFPGETFQKMGALRELVVDRLSNLTEEERSRITVHSGEKWSARKGLRRLLEHEGEHLLSIKEIL